MSRLRSKSPKLWTTEQVKRAFWKTFHQSGEAYFPEPTTPDPDYGESVTESEWNDFMEHLGGNQQKP